MNPNDYNLSNFSEVNEEIERIYKMPLEEYKENLLRLEELRAIRTRLEFDAIDLMEGDFNTIEEHKDE